VGKPARVARGEEPADLVLTGGTVVNVLAGTLRRADVAISGEHIAGVSATGYGADDCIDCAGRFVAPGLIEGHIHIESSMLAPWVFAQAVAQRGTTTVIADPHEIANVLGLDGVRFMLEASREAACEVLLTAPSCVPATTLDTAGAELGPVEVGEMLAWPEVVALGEMMDFPGVLAGDGTVCAKLQAARGKPIDGHAPGLSGSGLQAYIAAGPDSDHECTRLEEAREKLEAGMWIMIREGTVAQNLRDLLPLAQDPRTAARCLLVSDDLAPTELLREGHLDRILRRAVAEGLDAITAVRLVTLNAATRFRLHDRGALRAGLLADVVVFENLTDFRVAQVLKRGKPVEPGPALPPPVRIPAGTCRVGRLAPGRLDVRACEGPVRVIGIVPGQIVTECRWLNLPSAKGLLQADADQDVAKVAVVERHGRKGGVGVGFVQGLGLRKGALASSMSHDSHNVIVAGMDDAAMAAALETVTSSGGGLVVAPSCREVHGLDLPIAGLMSDRPLRAVAAEHRSLIRVARALGCTAPDPFAALSFLALPVIPALRITDQGLVDADRMVHVSLAGDIDD
jgi:adenine deaminase